MGPVPITLIITPPPRPQWFTPTHIATPQHTDKYYAPYRNAFYTNTNNILGLAEEGTIVSSNTTAMILDIYDEFLLGTPFGRWMVIDQLLLSCKTATT